MKRGTSVTLLPASINQERALAARELAARRGGGLPPETLTAGLAVQGHVSVAALRKTLRTLVLRHPLLRSNIFPNPELSDHERERRLRVFASSGILEPGLYGYRAGNNRTCFISTVDYRQMNDTALAAELGALLARERSRPVNHQRDWLTRAVVVKVRPFTYYLIFFIDHLVADGWSLNLIIRDLKHVCRAVLTGGSLPDTAFTSYAEFVTAQQRATSGDYFEHHLAFWRQQWRDYAAYRIGLQHLPFALPPSAPPDLHFANTALDLGLESTRDAMQFVRSSRSTLYTFFLTSFLIVLRHYTGSEKMAIWTHFSNRTRSEFESTVGLMVNTHLLGFEVSDLVTFSELLGDVRRRVMAGCKYQEMPLANMWRVLGCHPQVQDLSLLLDVHLDTPAEEVISLAGLAFDTLPLPESSSSRLAMLGVYVEGDRDKLFLKARFARRLFTNEGVAGMLADIALVARIAAETPGLRVGQFAAHGVRYSRSGQQLSPEMDQYVVRGIPAPPLIRTSPGVHGQTVG